METFLALMWAASTFLAIMATYQACMFKTDRNYWKSRWQDLRKYTDATEKHFDEAMELADREHRAKQIVCNDLAKRMTPEEYAQLQEVIELERWAKH